MLIAQNNLDKALPEIFIESPETGAISNQFSVSVTGVAKDDTFVKKILINGIPVRIDLASREIPFHKDALVNMGDNSIIVEATDLAGKLSVITRKVMCDLTGPVVNIDELKSTDKPGRYILKGYAHDNSGISEISVNSQKILKRHVREVVLNHLVILQPGQNKAVVIAKDQAGNRTRAEISISRQSSVIPGTGKSFIRPPLLLASLDTAFPLLFQSHFSQQPVTINQQPVTRGNLTPEKKDGLYNKLGDYYALIIGINDYDEWEPLKTSVNDVTELKKILVNRYGFPQKNIVFRTDKAASRDTLVQDLRHMAAGLKKTDNLLVYFAGHGQLDKTTGDGYWIPADGRRDDSSTWITNSVIRHILCSEHIKGKNILVIADACYSGTLLSRRPAETSRESQPDPFLGEYPRGKRASGKLTGKSEYHAKAFRLGLRPSRQVISSGGIEQVDDKGMENHSLFAWYFLKGLRENRAEFIDIKMFFFSWVFTDIVKKGGQRPDMRPYDSPMHKDGQFVLALMKPGQEDKSGIEDEEYAEYRDTSLLDSDPPVLNLRGWSENRTVFTDHAFLEISASDESGIQYVKINGMKIMKRPGRNLHFNHLSPLKQGDNIFVIECFDQLGNRTEKKINIRRDLQKVYQVGSRMSVAMLPFILKHDQRAEVEDILLGRLAESRRFNMRKADILRQMPPDYNQTEHQDRAFALARNMGADFVLMGSVAADEKSLQITAYIVEAGTSQLLTEQDVYGEDINAELTREMCRGLVIKLCDDLPLVEGRIVRIKDEAVIVNRGEINRVRKGMHLIFFQEGEPVQDIDTGELLGADVDELGTGRIERLSERMSYAGLFDKNALSRLKIGQRMITK